MMYKSNHERIAEIAYQSWIDRGQPAGSPEVDWYYALSVVSDPESLRVGSEAGTQSEVNSDQFDDDAVTTINGMSGNRVDRSEADEPTTVRTEITSQGNNRSANPTSKRTKKVSR